MSMILGFVPSAGMPARLAIKPEPFRQMLGYRQLRPYLQNNVPRRCLATQRKAVADDHPFAYTLLTKSPEAITPDDVLSSLPPIAPSLAESRNVPVLLLTSAFAQWADTTNLFLEQCINRLYSNTVTRDSTEPVHAIVAIVDKLPSIHSVEDNTGSVAAESEGLSLLLVSTENIEGKVVVPRRIRSSETEEAALVFSFPTDVSHKSDNAIPRRAVHEVGLRLANTLFVNGNENTLFGIRWSYNPSSSNFSFDRSIELSRCRVTCLANSIRNSLKLPLHPVGQRREVISSMGNILRQLAKHPNGRSKDPMPASSELENELPRYIEEHNIVDRKVSVWALVESLSHSSHSEMNGSQNRPAKIIQAGGTLHRVMSGGGGWGKKQGLLSLDYESSFLGPDNDDGLSALDSLFSPVGTSPVSPAPPSFDKTIVENLSSLSQVASAGDYIQFYVSIEPDHVQKYQLDAPEGAISYHFGVVPETEMFMDHTGNGELQKDLRGVPNYFGALSEKAMTYSQPLILARSDGEILESGTKLDIPGSRVELVAT